MSHGTEHHLQEAEHAQHHAHDPFDRRVAMTMAILAAMLAGVTMQSHRAHNETLSIQNEALRIQNEALAFQTEASKLETQVDTLHTKASDKWSYFQAKKNRLYQYEAFADLVGVLPKDGSRSGADGTADPKGGTAADKLAQNWKGKVKKYQQDSDEIEKEARQLEQEALAKRKEIEELEKKVEHKKEESVHKREESVEVHHRANRLDFGHLGLELALVVCSVAVLTKQRGFWFTGIGVGVIGLLMAASSFLMH
jgi:uncharacterized protein YlxW (UPF0749 family)